MAIDIEISHVSVEAFTNLIGQPAEGKDVRRAVECNGIFKREALPGKDFTGNGLKCGIVRLKPVPGWGGIVVAMNKIIPCCEGFAKNPNLTTDNTDRTDLHGSKTQ